jgi:hypothetical protein
MKLTIRLRRLNRKLLSVLWVSTLFVSLTFALAQETNVAPDATQPGPLAVTSAEYKFPAAIDPDVLDVPPPAAPRAVELWARVYRPTDLSGGPYPLVIFLHGNHATCGIGENPRFDDNTMYTTTGTCPPEYIVVPNHLGYAYLAERLASWGYLVVSINANRGITAGAGITGDAGLNLARGRLVLRHLQRLSEWNTRGNTPASLGVDLRGKIDFNYVGMMGHSRGGEGVRAAYDFYRERNSPWVARIPDRVRFQAIFEIGPVDGQTSRILTPDSLAWAVLLPMCDGDVSNLQGARPYDRALRVFAENPKTMKATYTVWGANHNYYNSEWEVTDSAGCWSHQPLFAFFGGSETQRETAFLPLLGFFRANVGPGANPEFNRSFNPLFALPRNVTDLARVDRGYSDSPATGANTVLEEFENPTGTNSWFYPNQASNITIQHINLVTDGTRSRHDPIQRVAVIGWTAAGENTFFQTNFSQGSDLQFGKTLDFRISRRYSPALNGDLLSTTDFSIRLVMGDGRLSNSVRLSAYSNLTGPVGGAFGGNLHAILQTVRIPLRDFSNVDLSQISGIRFGFDQTRTGTIFLGNVRVSAFDDGVPPVLAGAANATLQSASEDMHLAAGATYDQFTGTGVIKRVRRIGLTETQRRQGKWASDTLVEIEVNSPSTFPVMGELPVLRVGEKEFLLCRYPDSGATDTLIFTLTREEFAQLTEGEEVSVQYGRGDEPSRRWTLGALNRNALSR